MNKRPNLRFQATFFFAFFTLSSVAVGQTVDVSVSSVGCQSPVFYDFDGYMSGTASGPPGTKLSPYLIGLGPTTAGGFPFLPFQCGSWSYHYDILSRSAACISDGTSTTWTLRAYGISPISGYFLTTFDALMNGGGYAVDPAGNTASLSVIATCQMVITGSDITVGPASILSVRKCHNNSCSTGQNPQPLSITTAAIPDALYNSLYSFSLQASGGSPPYTWSVQNDPSYSPPSPNYFPPAFSFSSDGVITSGPPGSLTAGVYGIVITVTDSGQQSTSKSFTFTVSCSDAQRDQLTQEYRTYAALDLFTGLNDPPACSDPTRTAQSAIFSFNQLNVNSGYNWGLIRYPLTVPAIGGGTFGLDTWALLLGYPNYSPIINDGYRSPAHNALVGGTQGSRHMWGDAVDLQNVIHPNGDRLSCNPQYDPQHPSSQPAVKTPCLSEYIRMVQDAGFALANYVEPPNLSCAYNCVHADWRNWPGPLQHGPGDLP